MAKTKEPKDGLSYFDQRMASMGITPEINIIALHQTELQTGKAIMAEVPIFTEVEKGIKILVYTLDRLSIRIEKNSSRMKEDFAMTRLKDPIIKPNGDVIKYLIPKGAGTQPFFPPSVIEKFEQKIPMKTVYLTEGYFKAFKAAMHGIDIIGLSSITHMKDKETGLLHPDIMKLLRSGLVERLVWLTDGDCLDITNKEITGEKDLYTRPRGFFASVKTFKDLLADEMFEGIDKWFMHIDIDAILEAKEIKGITRDQVKGLDDLLITYAGREDEIVADIKALIPGGSAYFQKFNITHGTNKAWKHFHLTNVEEFFLFHSERRPELKDTAFKFLGTKYQYNKEKSVCEVIMPGDANLFFRVGDDYYKWIEKPNQHHQIEKVFVDRKKATITDDYSRDFAKHVPKYEAFCNVPDHNNFQQVIHNCFNVYSPIDHVPDEDECFPEDFPNIMKLIVHIFGEKIVHFSDKETKERKEFKTVQIGLDYLQLLYQQPAQKLPILCLVSKENGTGKSTLGFFLRSMLGANVAIVGNADLANDFNAHWATKSVVICDEAKIDKHQVIEKIKALSTAHKIFMNAKGRGQVELDCFIKFILMTNNEENFIYANEDDVRYWVLKVPVLRTDDPHIMGKLVDEIPAFLSFLNKRKMATDQRSRMWFHPELLKTDALRKVIQYSQSTIVKELRTFFKDLFLDTGMDEILMTAEVVMKEALSKRYEKNYLAKVLQDDLKVQQYHVWVVDNVEGKEYHNQQEALSVAEIKHPDSIGHMLYGRIKPKYKVRRYTYPSYQERLQDGIKERVRVEVKEEPSRPYVFKRSDFVTYEEDKNTELSPEVKFLKDVLSDNAPAVRDNSLPFG
jgi:hypothetical protein